LSSNPFGWLMISVVMFPFWHRQHKWCVRTLSVSERRKLKLYTEVLGFVHSPYS
jgi:hypothetical protein